MAREPRSPASPTIGYLRYGPMLAVEDWPGRHTELLEALARHAPTLEPDLADGCWLDLRGGGRRAPAPAALASALLATAREEGCTLARLGVAPTPGVARLAALHGPDEPTVLEAGSVAAFLGPLPIGALGVEEAVLERLALVGLHTLGHIAALPRGALGDYLGAAGLPIEALARGEDDRPLTRLRPPLVLRARRDLDYTLTDRAQLIALLESLLAPLLAALRHRGLGATRATLTLCAAGGRPAAVTVPLASATTALPAVLGPLLAALPDPAADEDGDARGLAAIEVALSAPRPLVGRQGSIFDVPQGQRARLAAGVVEARRRCDGQLGYLRPADPTHALPERRYVFDAAAAPDDTRSGTP